jgi:hypothetical protein
MSVDLYYEIWNELKRHINIVDRQEAAENLVSVLIDNDVDADDIKTSFKSDSEVKRALTSYLKDHPVDAEDDEDYDDDDYDDSDDEDEDY